MRFFLSFLIFSLFCGTLFSQKDTLLTRTTVDNMPFFAGCESLKNDNPEKRKCSDEKLTAFITKYLVYPEAAITNKVEGTAVVSFQVEEDGRISEPQIVRDLGSGCGQAALDILKSMPRWQPAERAGKKIKVKLTMPVRFYFKSQTNDESKSYAIHWGKLRGDIANKATLQDCLDTQLYVRDANGNAVHIAELAFTLEKKRKSDEAKISGGSLDKKMKKIIQKASSGSTLTISATVQKDAKMIVVEKSFLVKD
jgi:TonB family protein